MQFLNSVSYVGEILAYKDKDRDFEVINLYMSVKGAGFVSHVSDMASVNESDISILLPELQFMITKQLTGYHRFPISFVILDVR